MKKVITILLVITMMSTLFGCGIADNGTDSEKTSKAVPIETFDQFVVGYGEADITPYESVPLGSFGDEANRFCTGYWDYLYAQAIVMSDADGNSMILVMTDLSWGDEFLNAMVRSAVTEKYQIPEDCVIVGGNHNHQAPAWDYNDPSVDEYNKYWLKSVMSSIEDALADRKPAELQIGRTETENLTFVRRYWQEDGNLMGDNYQLSDSPIVSHETEADEEVQILRFARENEKDILVVNWQTHNSISGWGRIATTELVGPMRDKVKAELDCHCVYFQGACGNLNPVSRIEGETVTRDRVEHGEALAKVVVEAVKSEKGLETVQSNSIQNEQIRFEGKYKDGSENTMELNTIAIGDVSIVTLPVEMFDYSGMQIKDNTPDKMTLLMGYTCGVTRYCPPEYGFENGGYEYENCKWASGTAEQIVDTYLKTLKEFNEAEK